MKPLDGEPNGQTYEHPLIGYKMWGVPCANCGLPMEGLWVFREQLEVWHFGTDRRCRMSYVEHAIVTAPRERKADGRRLPRRYGRCRLCSVRFALPVTEEGIPKDHQDLCKSCRNQQGLFTDDEIPGVPADLSNEPERTRDH